MNNPYDPIKEPRKHAFYSQGYEKGKHGFQSNPDRQISREDRTSWSKGYFDACKHRQMKQLILGDRYYDYIYEEQNNAFYDGKPGHYLLNPRK